MSKQIKSKSRVRNHGEVFTAEREVKAMCDLIDEETWRNIEANFLEPSCGDGNFLVEILKRKLEHCKDERDGLKALNAIFGIDLLPDNVATAKVRMLEIFKGHFPNATNFTVSLALAILNNRIICDDSLDPKTEIVKSWGITADEKYVKFKNKRKERENAESNNT